MIRQTLLLAVAVLAATTGMAMEFKLDHIQIGAVTYTNVVITGVNPADVYFHHNGGMANVKLRQLDPAIQKKFHYDADAAASAEQERMDSDERYRQEAVQKFTAHVEQEYQAATNAPEAPFSLAEPLSDHSPLDRPAPRMEVNHWLGEVPDLRDKYALVYFWNSTSEPCRQAIPALNDLGQKFATNMNFITLTTEAPDQLRPLDTPLVCYAGVDPQAKFAADLGVSSVPTVAVIDTKGVVRFVGHPAALTEDALTRIMARYPAE